MLCGEETANDIQKETEIGINCVTPNERHSGKDREILLKRKALYEEARTKYPECWMGKTRAGIQRYRVAESKAENRRKEKGGSLVKDEKRNEARWQLV